VSAARRPAAKAPARKGAAAKRPPGAVSGKQAARPAKKAGAKKAAAKPGTPRRAKASASSAKPRAASGRSRRVDDATVLAVVAALHDGYPDAQTALLHEDPLQLLVATILSAQSTDERVNLVTRTLFKKYRSVADYAAADPTEFERDIHSTGFFRNKTKSVLGTARLLREKHGGVVPAAMEALLELPGVARKTANVVLGSAFGIAEGVVVDTHVARLSYRLGFTLETDPVKIERDLMRRVPRAEWIFLSHGLILHGRRVCIARKPHCSGCPLAGWCPRNGVTTST
jgi:endonuclease-3